MRIKALAAQLGVSIDWLRRKERAGLIPRATRDLNGHRRYCEEDVALLRAILFPADGSS
jgi:DNA-binding transcriptional MerR regulator